MEKEAFHTRPLPAHARCHSRPPPCSARSPHATPASHRASAPAGRSRGLPGLWLRECRAGHVQEGRVARPGPGLLRAAAPPSPVTPLWAPLDARRPLELGPLGAAGAAVGRGRGGPRPRERTPSHARVPESLRPCHSRDPVAVGPPLPRQSSPRPRRARSPSPPDGRQLAVGDAQRLTDLLFELGTLAPLRVDNLGPKSHGGRSSNNFPGIPGSTALSWVGPESVFLQACLISPCRCGSRSRS